MSSLQEYALLEFQVATHLAAVFACPALAEPSPHPRDLHLLYYVLLELVLVVC